MTTKKDTPKGSPPKFEFKGFFNPIIGNDIKAVVKQQASTPTAVIAALDALIDAGFKVSFSADAAQTHITGTLTDKRPKSDSYGYVMSVKHIYPSTIIMLLLVLQQEVYDWNGWLPWIENTVEVDW